MLLACFISTLKMVLFNLSSIFWNLWITSVASIVCSSVYQIRCLRQWSCIHYTDAGGQDAEQDQEIAEKLQLLKDKISSNVSAMPIVLKRMKECISKIDKLDSYNGIIHPAFKRKKTSWPNLSILTLFLYQLMIWRLMTRVSPNGWSTLFAQ